MVCIPRQVGTGPPDSLMGCHLSFLWCPKQTVKKSEDRSRGGFHYQLSILCLNTYMDNTHPDQGI